MTINHLIPVGEEDVHSACKSCLCHPDMVPQELMKDLEEIDEESEIVFQHFPFSPIGDVDNCIVITQS